MAPKTSRKSVRCSDQAVRRERALRRTQESGQAQHNRYTMSQGWRRGVSIVPSSLPRASWYVMIPCRADMTPVSALPSLQTHVTRGIRARRLESAQNGTVLVKYVTSGVTCGPNTMLIPPTVGRHIILCPRVAIYRAKNAPWRPQECQHLVLGHSGWPGERPEFSRYTFRVCRYFRSLFSAQILIIKIQYMESTSNYRQNTSYHPSLGTH